MIDASAPNGQRTPTAMRELDHRTSDGIEVTLFWNSRTNQVVVAVLDTRLGRALRFEVAARDAREAFHHPFAFAPHVQDTVIAA